MSSCTERNPIRHRMESDWTANGIRSDGGRNPIGWRTESDWTANANGRGCSCLSCTNQANRTIYSNCLHCTNQANWQSIAAVSAAPTKQTGNLLQLSPLHQPSNKANDTNVGGYGIPAVATQPSTQISFH